MENYQKIVQVSGGGGNTSHYMSPLKIFEYMAAKKPIICSDLPVLKEVLNSHNAVLVEPESVTKWNEALSHVIHNREYSKSISNTAYTDLSEKFTWSIRAQRISELIENYYD